MTAPSQNSSYPVSIIAALQPCSAAELSPEAGKRRLSGRQQGLPVFSGLWKWATRRWAWYSPCRTRTSEAGLRLSPSSVVPQQRGPGMQTLGSWCPLAFLLQKPGGLWSLFQIPLPAGSLWWPHHGTGLVDGSLLLSFMNLQGLQLGTERDSDYLSLHVSLLPGGPSKFLSKEQDRQMLLILGLGL